MSARARWVSGHRRSQCRPLADLVIGDRRRGVARVSTTAKAPFGFIAEDAAAGDIQDRRCQRAGGVATADFNRDSRVDLLFSLVRRRLQGTQAAVAHQRWRQHADVCNIARLSAAALISSR